MERLRRDVANKALFEKAKEHALDYMRSVDSRPVFPSDAALKDLEAFDEPLQDGPQDPCEVLDFLHGHGSPATVAQTGGRYFGFVNGGITPAGLAAKWLGDAWDQNAALYVISPVAAALETVCEQWLVDLLGLPAGTAMGLVGGTSTATLCGLAAGRDELLRRAGWDAGARGLFGAPEIRVVLGSHAHSTVYKALSLLGLGRERIQAVPVDAQGRMRPEALPKLDGQTLLVLQAGNVSSGAFDPFVESIAGKRGRPDAGFTLTGHLACGPPRPSAPTPDKGHRACGLLVGGCAQDAERAVRQRDRVLSRPRSAGPAMRMSGSYIVFSEKRDGMLYTPDMSRRARSVELWATLKNLGRDRGRGARGLPVRHGGSVCATSQGGGVLDLQRRVLQPGARHLRRS